MSGAQIGFHDYTLGAAGDLSTKQYTFVKISAEHTVTTAGDADAAVIGVQMDDLATAAGIGVLVRPITATTGRIKMGAACAVGLPVTSGAAGRGRAAVAGEPYYGRLLEASTADGDIVEMVFVGAQYFPHA